MKAILMLAINVACFALHTGCNSHKIGSYSSYSYYVIDLVGFDQFKHVELFVGDRIVFDGYPVGSIVLGTYGRFYVYGQDDAVDIEIVVKYGPNGKMGNEIVVRSKFMIQRKKGMYVIIDYNWGDIEFMQAGEYFQHM